MKKNNLIFLLGIAVTALFSGCVGQPPIHLTKDIKSFKDYIVKKRANKSREYNIIAEKSYQTIIEYRTYNEPTNSLDARDIMEILDDAKEYCQAIGGNSLYGDQSIKELKSLPTSFSITYFQYREKMRIQGSGHYSGFYKCASAKDGFDIEYMKDNIALRQDHMFGGGYMRTYSRYYLITHNNPQNENSKFWFKSDKYKKFATKYNTPKKLFSDDDTVQSGWRYEGAIGAQKYCSYHGGNFYIANAVSSYKKMSIDDYYFARLDQIKNTGTINIFMAIDYFWCENPNNKIQEFTLIHDNNKVYFKKHMSKNYLKAKGVSFKKITINFTPIKNPTKTKELSKKTVLSSYNAKMASSLKVHRELATYTLATKSDTFKLVGQVKYESSYNGIEPDGCTYASITKKILNNSQIQNFKKCNDKQIIYVGRTRVEELTDEVKEQLRSISEKLKANCKLQNQAVAKINEFTFKCLKNPFNDNYKFIMMKDGMLINRY